MNTTVRDVVDFLIYVGGLAVAVTAIGVVLRYLVVRPLKKWITEHVLKQIEPNGSGDQSTTRQLIERHGQQLTAFGEQLSSLTAELSANRAVAEEARTIAQSTSERLDRHIEQHGGV